MYKFDLKNESLNFAIEIIKIYKFLINNKEYILSKQLLRSGTSIGANVFEALHAQSKKDFLSKITISFKEANETKYWLHLLEKTNYIKNYNSKDNIFKKLDEIIAILTRTIKSTKNQLNIL